MVIIRNKKIFILILFLSLIFFFLAIYNIILSKDKEEKLLFVFELIRLGAKNQSSQINKTIWKDYNGIQSQSLGELNSLGLRAAYYLLGTDNKSKYINFLLTKAKIKGLNQSYEKKIMKK